MQIVINISEENYKNIKEQVDKRDYPDMQIGRLLQMVRHFQKDMVESLT